MPYDENETQFLNEMEQEVFMYLPDAYREVMIIKSRPVAVDYGDRESEDTIPEYVEVRSPEIFGLWVRFTFDVYRKRISGGHSGPNYRSVYCVTVTDKDGVLASASTDDMVYRTHDGLSRTPSFFMDMFKDVMKDVFGVMDNGRRICQPLIESVLAVNKSIMTNFRKHIPGEWDVYFRQSILKEYGIPFIDGIDMVLGDDAFISPVKVNAHNYAMPEIRFPDIEERFFVNLEDSPEDLRAFVSDETRKVAYRLVEYLGSEIDLRKEFWRKNGKG